jgi:hypothetical protein
MTIDYHRVWEKMNDLEMVSTKISSAREILDCAVDRLQEHQYDKAETLLYAVDEYLQYYLEEFDRKFKDAWKETVTKVHQQELMIVCHPGDIVIWSILLAIRMIHHQNVKMLGIVFGKKNPSKIK